MTSYQLFLQANELKLLGYFLLAGKSGDSRVLETPYPPSFLNEDQLVELKDQLRACMPLDSMITDLWDWDVHFEEDLSDDWYFEAIFGDETNVGACSEVLAEFSLEKCDEYEIDYNQTASDPEFAALVFAEA